MSERKIIIYQQAASSQQPGAASCWRRKITLSLSYRLRECDSTYSAMHAHNTHSHLRASQVAASAASVFALRFCLTKTIAQIMHRYKIQIQTHAGTYFACHAFPLLPAQQLFVAVAAFYHLPFDIFHYVSLGFTSVSARFTRLPNLSA